MYFDLEQTVRTDGAFAAKLQKLSNELEVLFRKASRHAKYARQANEKLLEIIKFCQYNPFLLVGYFFPAYPRGEPLSFVDYPFVAAMLNFSPGGFTVIRGSRQIAKSTSMSVRQILFSQLIPTFRSLYICPRSQQLKTYANKLREVERAYRGYKPDYKFRSNLYFKEFENKSQIELIHVLTDPSPARGKSADELLYDEYQDFDADLETEVEQIQSASVMPTTIYSGTSLTTDTALEVKYLRSSQSIWSIRCDCGHYNIPLPEYNVLDMIQQEGPSCVKCRRLLNVRTNGQFVHGSTDMLNCGQIGLHVPQIIVPAVVNNPARWASIYRLKMTTPNIRKFYQELLGIPTQEGEREITRKHLEDLCMLGDLEPLHSRAKKKGYRWVVSGCDWGGTDPSIQERLKISTTVHVMMGIRPGTYEFDIIHMRRYDGMDYDSITADICMNHHALGGTAIASDVGVGAVYNSGIRKIIPPDKHLMFQYVGPRSVYIDEPKDSHTYNQWSLNKTESITDLFQACKQKRIRCYRWDLAQEHLLDFLNMYRSPAELPSGATTMIYRSSATKPNDTIQACNYCYVLGRILIGEPIFADKSIQQRIEQSIGRGALGIFPDGLGGFSM